MSQRKLAARTGIAQPTIARIESGRDNPRVDTLERLLEACGETMETLPRAGLGIDRSLIRELLALTPAQRAATLADDALLSDLLGRAARIG